MLGKKEIQRESKGKEFIKGKEGGEKREKRPPMYSSYSFLPRTTAEEEYKLLVQTTTSSYIS